jgi:ubiquitin-protein ligase
MIPVWVPKKGYPQTMDSGMGPEFGKIPRSSAVSKECAICRRHPADYEHSCGVAFHKNCIEQYFSAISGVEGAERICPHCYAPVPLTFDEKTDAAIEVSPIPEDVYNQYLEISDEFSLAIMGGSIRDISVFLNSPDGEQYFVNIDFEYYPKKPTFSFSDELLINIDGLDNLLEILNNWDPKLPPRLVDVLLNIQSRIRPQTEKTEEKVVVDEAIRKDEAPLSKDILKDEKKEEFVEFLPEGDVVEVTLEGSEDTKEKAFEANEVLPATFFETDFTFEPFYPEAEPTEDTFENEEAIQQYLNLSNSFSVELMEEKIYHAVVYISSLDAGIYNIYPITINYKEFPKKPMLTLTDDLLIRIRRLDEILERLKQWDHQIAPDLVDFLQQIEIKLVEDSMVEGELEIIKREYNTRRLTKNKIQITLSTYGPRLLDIELDLKEYPHPPIITLPDELRDLDVKNLEGIKKWQDRPQKRIMDVIRNLSQVINNLYRKGFEESLLKMISKDFEVVGDGYRVVIAAFLPQNKDADEDIPEERKIEFRIRVTRTYPLFPPEIEVNSEDKELGTEVRDLLTDILKSWTPTMFIADAINRLSLSLWNKSLFNCLICGRKQCPTCEKPLLTEPVIETNNLCEMPCIQCKRPYHVHCLTQSMGKGTTECGYCLTDLGKLLGKKFFRFVEE